MPAATPFSWSAFFSIGFRPFYALSCLWGIVSIAVWVYYPTALTGWLPAYYWHAHEMLWGFVVTIAAGFLLTASANWTGHNPLRGKPLALLALFWVFIRLGLLLPEPLGFYLSFTASLAFYALLTAALARVIMLAGNRRNLLMPVFVGSLGLSDLLFLWSAYQNHYQVLSQYLQTGLLLMCLVTLLIGRRVIPFFTSRAIPSREVPMHLRTGMAQLALTVVAVASVWLAWPSAQAFALMLIAVLAIIQAWHWWSAPARHIPLLWILYLGWLGLAGGLLVTAAQSLDLIHNPAWSAHTIGMAGFGLLIIGMITRTALGHLGLPLKTDRSIFTMYALFIGATLLRLAAIAFTAARLPLLHMASLAWILCLVLYLWRFLPTLLRPRADGKL